MSYHIHFSPNYLYISVFYWFLRTLPILHDSYSLALYGKQILHNYPFQLHIPEYDLDTLYVLRSHAAMYIHGHSAGGTNPSLVEAMFFGKPILAFDVIYNRATTDEQAYYFKDSDSLQKLINQEGLNGDAMRTVAQKQYIWNKIASQYEALY